MFVFGVCVWIARREVGVRADCGYVDCKSSNLFRYLQNRTPNVDPG